MGRKRKLRRQMRKRGLEDAPTLVICIGKKCCSPSLSRAVVDESRTYAAAMHPGVRIEVVGCLNVCKHGPVAATYPRITFKRHVDPRRARKLIDKIAR
jgi:(2Fe-2S) ferredoxin